MATIPVPGSATAGAVAPAATANTWRDSAQFLLGSTVTTSGSKRPLAVLRNVTPFSLAVSGTTYDLPFDTEDADTDNGHSTVTATHLYTFNTPGTYLILGHALFASNATGHRVAYFNATLNSVVTTPAQSNCNADSVAGQLQGIHLSAILVGVLAGDTVSIKVVQTSGGALSTSANGGGSRLQVLWLGN